MVKLKRGLFGVFCLDFLMSQIWWFWW